jgi:hypothetical protein
VLPGGQRWGWEADAQVRSTDNIVVMMAMVLCRVNIVRGLDRGCISCDCVISSVMKFAGSGGQFPGAGLARAGGPLTG